MRFSIESGEKDSETTSFDADVSQYEPAPPRGDQSVAERIALTVKR